MRTPGIILCTVLLTLAATVGAQTLDTDNPRSHREVLAMGLYPPDLIMRHQQRLGITDAQRDEMLKQVRAFQDDVADLQWNLQNEQQLLRQTLAQDRIDLETAMPQVEQVLRMESEFKRAHFRLLIAIKNALTEEQIGMIREYLRRLRS